jgi:hypothetical protein
MHARTRRCIPTEADLVSFHAVGFHDRILPTPLSSSPVYSRARGCHTRSSGVSQCIDAGNERTVPHSAAHEQCLNAVPHSSCTCKICLPPCVPFLSCHITLIFFSDFDLGCFVFFLTITGYSTLTHNHLARLQLFRTQLLYNAMQRPTGIISGWNQN